MVLNKLKTRLFGNDEVKIEIEKAGNMVDTRRIEEVEQSTEKSKGETKMTVTEKIIEAREQREALDQEDGKSGSYTEGPYAGELDKFEFKKEKVVKGAETQARFPMKGKIVFPVTREDGTWAIHEFDMGRRLRMNEVVLLDTIMNDLPRSPLLRKAKKTGEFYELIKQWVNKCREKTDLPIPTWRNSWDQ